MVKVVGGLGLGPGPWAWGGGGGVLPIKAYMGRLHPKGYLFQASGI